MVYLSFPIVDSEREYTCQKDSFWVNQIHTQSPVTIVCRGLSCTLHIRGKQQTELWRLLHCTPAHPTPPLWRKPYFDHWAENCPIKSELHSYILIYIFTNQSEHQSSSIMTIENTRLQSIRAVLFEQSNCKFGSLICIKMDRSIIKTANKDDMTPHSF